MNEKNTPISVGKVADTVVNGAIHVGSAAAGAMAGGYIINHDAMNDQDMSTFTGVAVGVGVFAILDAGLMAIKKGTVRAGKAVVTMISGDSKKVAAGKVKKTKKSKKED